MKRTIVRIDEERCNGCGECVGGCHEGALQLINGKAVMVSELYCDGLGACIGECPVGAISLEEREAEPYNEIAVMQRLVPKGEQIVVAHLSHLKQHGELDLLQQGIDYLKKNNVRMNIDAVVKPVPTTPSATPCACPGVANLTLAKPTGAVEMGRSELQHFPIQLHLINPQAAVFAGSDLLLAADCCAFVKGDFHAKVLRGKTLTIACPKLDNTQNYVAKLGQLIDVAKINTLTVAIMEVPCCNGLRVIAERAIEQASRKINMSVLVISTRGTIK